MALIIEDGTIVPNANSYVTTTELQSYIDARGITLTGSLEPLILQAMDYVETLCFSGIKRTRDQSLQFPRLCVKIDGYSLDSDTIPQELKNGVVQCAIAIDEGTGPQEDLQRKTTFEKVGDLEVHYSESSSSATVNRKVRDSLRKLLLGGGQTIVNKG